MTYRSSSLAMATGALLVLAGCGSAPKPENPTPQRAPTPTTVAEPSAPSTGAGAPAAGDATAADEARRREDANRARAVLAQRIYFDYDRSDLTPQARATLNAQLEVLRNYPAVTIMISGHADERGSDEYNLALGNRRANSVRQFLVQYGVLSGRMQTVSYGEEQPAVNGHGETAWSQNRRAEFQIQSGL